MRQFQFEYLGAEDLNRQLGKIKQWCRGSVTGEILFTIFSEILDSKLLGDICKGIRTILPDAKYIGCSTNGNIFGGEMSQKSAIICCNVFEYPSTKLMILQYPLTEETEKSMAEDLFKKVKANPWINSIEILTTIRGMSMTGFCEDLSALPEHINIFGGGAFSEDMNDQHALVFSSVSGISDHAVVFALMGGNDFHTHSVFITGWKPLGRELLVTKAQGSKLYELDGKPAYDTYYKYLNISNDENFFHNTLEFPFLYEHNGIQILRAPTAANEDGSLTMTSDMEENVHARIAYGDPWTILDSIGREARKLSHFQPEAITIFSCAARRTFWGSDAGKESRPFQSCAPTSGFYTSGEFLRTNGKLNQHNVTLVITGMREGDLISDDDSTYEGSESEIFSGQVSMINRLATFIQAATDELYEANKQLADANRKLAKTAITDPLTGLYNRGEIQRRITDTISAAKAEKEGAPAGVSLIMIDIDNFKKVNDTFGHKEGDLVLVKLSEMLMKYVGEKIPSGSVGRWGGEEFMILLPDTDLDSAVTMAEDIRLLFANISFPQAGFQTMSLGVTEALSGENPDTSCMRVDKALYEAKNTGKNKVLIR